MSRPPYGPGRSSSRLRSLRRPLVVGPIVAVAAIAVAVPLTLGAAKPTAKFQGLNDGQTLGKEQVSNLALRLDGVSAGKVHATLDQQPVQFTGTGSDLLFKPGHLADGSHTLDIRVDGALGDSHITRTFTVDTTPPKVEAAAPKPLPMGEPLTLTGTVDSGATVTANGQRATVSGSTWKTTFAKAPRSVKLLATDKAGNTATAAVSVRFTLPTLHAVHMTALAWAYKPKHDAVVALIKAGKINAVEVDIKDEDGNVGYPSAVPLAKQDGSTKDAPYDAKKMIAELHAMHATVIGRLVAFHDPKLAQWAWDHGKHDMVLQTSAHQPWQGSYGHYAFTNFANTAVQTYNIDLAVEAAKLGYDHILYDYVRRADGKVSEMYIPDMKGTPEVAVAGFVQKTREALQKAGTNTYLGASVFGIAASRPTQIAQNIPAMSKYLDYVSPMVYPSHWGQGEYGVANPNAQPYDIVNRSLKDFQAKVKGTNAVVMPWLQDFSLGMTYDAPQVLAQEKAAHDLGINSFLLWNASCNYHADALPVMKH